MYITSFSSSSFGSIWLQLIFYVSAMHRKSKKKTCNNIYYIFLLIFCVVIILKWLKWRVMIYLKTLHRTENVVKKRRRRKKKENGETHITCIIFYMTLRMWFRRCMQWGCHRAMFRDVTFSFFIFLLFQMFLIFCIHRQSMMWN